MRNLVLALALGVALSVVGPPRLAGAQQGTDGAAVGTSGHAHMLSGPELKALLDGHTLHGTFPSGARAFSQDFHRDHSVTAGVAQGTWHIMGNKMCLHWRYAGYRCWKAGTDGQGHYFFVGNHNRFTVN